METISLLTDFIDVLSLERQSEDYFIGRSGFTPHGSIFGGQLMGQALSAVNQTVEGRFCHAFNCQFLRAGDVDNPLAFSVERLRDGRNFSHRRVIVSQKEKPVLTMDASYQVVAQEIDDAFVHQPDMPDVTEPEAMPGMSSYREVIEELRSPGFYDFLATNNVFEFRFSEAPSYVTTENRPAQQRFWLKSRFSLPDDQALQTAMLAYISDHNFIGVVTLPYRAAVDGKSIPLTSLNHSMWFHHPVDLNDWLLFDVSGSAATGHRGLAIGRIYSRQGQLVASLVQEGLPRLPLV